jgi:YebC/PmpR family DNA-binding regulatory protein
MSGHSKWNNIKRKKEKTDAQKGKIFTKIGREISVAVKLGGPDPSSNSKLKELVSKAKSLNVPNDNIDRIIKKAAGSGDKDTYEDITYEGYGPNGIAVIVEALTDNRNRTASDVRHYFDKFGGNLGTTGCVSYLFEDKGIIVVELGGKDEDAAMEDFLEAGAIDLSIEDSIAEIETEPNDVYNIKDVIEDKGYVIISAEAEKVPSTYVNLTDEESAKKMNLLLENLEDNDDVQKVWHNWENEDEFDF